jgi:potassium-transporting ATPase KdpC subunit
VNGKNVGSKLIAQKFEEDKYFWGRPSSIDYNPLPSGGSNLALSSAALKKVVEERQLKLQNANYPIPPELLFASGSGLDPHLSVAATYFQIDRVAKARSVERKDIQSLIDNMTIKPFLGEEYINILLLNLKLDEIVQGI